MEMLTSFTQTLEDQSPLRFYGVMGEAMFFEMAGLPEKCLKSVSEGLEFFPTLGEVEDCRE